jgi:hypothetical protein
VLQLPLALQVDFEVQLPFAFDPQPPFSPALQQVALVPLHCCLGAVAQPERSPATAAAAIIVVEVIFMATLSMRRPLRANNFASPCFHRGGERGIHLQCIHS